MRLTALKGVSQLMHRGRSCSCIVKRQTVETEDRAGPNPVAQLVLHCNSCINEFLSMKIYVLQVDIWDFSVFKTCVMKRPQKP